ncbi:MAG: 5-oxoprolinase subunit PxpB [Bacteroidetes bacterium]|nr:5-oxoprolinase subunit PxpB [Bacteroidota bacterium]
MLNLTAYHFSLNSDCTIFPLGDSSATLDLGNIVNEGLNQKVIEIKNWLQKNSFEGLKDIIIAYSSVSIVYDPFLIKERYQLPASAFEFVIDKLLEAFESATREYKPDEDIITIPVCYDEMFGNDLKFIAAQKNIPVEKVIELHHSKTYRLYMIGFLPGFSYMAEVDEQIAIPRKQKPVPVIAGSVGIAGSQTGIYPLNCPGGWQIVGRTPIKLFEPFADSPVKLKSGNLIKFYPITKEEFENNY